MLTVDWADWKENPAPSCKEQCAATKEPYTSAFVSLFYYAAVIHTPQPIDQDSDDQHHGARHDSDCLAGSLF